MAYPGKEDEVRESLTPMISNNSPSNAFKCLSLGAASATAGPSAPRSPSSSRLQGQIKTSLSPNAELRNPLHRSPSSMGQRSRSETPTLLRKASMNSLHGVGGVTPARSSSRASTSRRSSSAHMLNASTMVGRSPLSEMGYNEPPPPRQTAASIAQNHFKAELELHEDTDGSRSADTIVILHDSVYGHRYSRPRTSKASLSTIVERPERIQACVLGLSIAYVCLGERHSGGQHALHPDIHPSTIPSIPFRIRKTTRTLPLASPTVTNVHGTKWMEELKIMCDNAESRLAMNGKELTRPDMNRGSEGEAPKFHEGDLYLCAESLSAMEGALGAVCEGVDAVFEGSASGKGPHRTFVAIRPPGHHCSSSYPSGFCWLNNVHVGISHATLTHGLTHAVIIDFDLHHGDGSQAIAWDHNRRAFGLAKNALPWKKTSIGYFSLHDINSYPCEQGDDDKIKNASLCIENAHGQTIWNVHLQPWRSEVEFWQLYETRYSVILDKARTYLKTQTERLRAINNGAKPKGAIFISAGFDASEWESSGMQRHKVNVPTEFYARLTRDVVKLAAEEGTAVDGRVISVLEGGYSDRALCTGVLSHLSGMTAGDPLVITKERSPNGLGYEMGQKVGAFDGLQVKETICEGTRAYDPLWWSVPRLEQLDAVRNPEPIPEQRVARDPTIPTYSSPTQSFIAKVTSPQGRRNVSNMSKNGGSPKAISRAPSPPPPEVDWTVAANELSQLLIPSERTTTSCQPEDLSAEATRVRRDRQSAPTSGSDLATEQPTSRMALRTRKPAKAIEAEEVVARKSAPKTSRRKTVAGPAIINGDKDIARSTTPKPEPSYTKPTDQSNRRLSLVSNADSIVSEANVGHKRLSNGYVQQRPGTSQSVKPELSSSYHGRSVVAAPPVPSVPPVAVRKARVPRAPPAEMKTSRVRKKSPPTDSGKPSVENSSPKAQPLSSSDIAQPSIETSDMDSLTAGMKHIKLSLTTQFQRDAREQSKQAPKSTTMKSATASTAAKPTKSRSASRQPAGKEPAPILPRKKQSPAQSTEPQLPQYKSPRLASPRISKPSSLASSPPKGAKSNPQLSSSPPIPSRQPVRTPQLGSPQSSSSITLRGSPSEASSKAEVFVPYQPEGPPANTTIESKSLHWLPPNTSTPAAMKKGGLPVFTSTGTIPFGPQKANGYIATTKEEENTGERKEVDVWEIPETPSKT